MTNLHHLLPLTLIIIITLILSPPTPHAKPLPFNNIYAFGDSYTDTGNTASNSGPSGFMFVSNPPYGRTFFHHPTNRYSDGRLVIDFVADSLSLPFLPPHRNRTVAKSNGGVNFAVAGSTAIIHSFFVKNNMSLDIIPESLTTQLTWFEKLLAEKGCVDSTRSPKECEAVFKDALIWVGEIGANDYAYSFGSSVPSKTIQHLAITSVTNFLQALLKKGAKYVVVQGLPPTGCLTLSMYLAPTDDRDKTGCAGSANRQSFTHNAILKAKLDSFRKSFPKSVIVYADYYDAYLRVVKNASRYGFKELFKACCGYGGDAYNFNYFNACGSPSATSCSDPSQYVNWDGVHLTEAMYQAMARAFLDGSSTQPPFSYLLSKKRQSN